MLAGKYSPHLDTSKTTTVAGGLHEAGHDVTVASGCDGAAEQPERRRLQQGCGCVSCPCPSGAGKTPYECKTYSKSSVLAAISASDLCVIAVGLGSNVESEGRDREAQGLALPGLQNNLTTDAIAAAKAKNIPIIALLFVAGAPNARDVEDKSRSLSAEAVKH